MYVISKLHLKLYYYLYFQIKYCLSVGVAFCNLFTLDSIVLSILRRSAPDILSDRIVTKSYYPVSGRIFTIIRPDNLFFMKCTKFPLIET